MTFTIRNGNASYTLPLDPQHWIYSPQPRYGVQKTLGGQVVQLLGYSVSGSFGGLLHNHMVSRQDAWNDMQMLKSFMVPLLQNQQLGIQSHISWIEEGYDFDCALGDFEISESIDQTGLQYEIPFFRVSQSIIKNANDRADLVSKMLQEIGFSNPSDGGWHGGAGEDIWRSAITPFTGFDYDGPRVIGNTSSSSSSDANVAHGTSKDIAELQAYAKKKVLAMGWTEQDFQDLVQMWNRESNWNYTAVNPTNNDATGIPQSMKSLYQNNADPRYRWPSDFLTNPYSQIDWGLNYIKLRYGSPSAAWRQWTTGGGY